MTNQEAIKILSQHSEHWKRLLNDNICSKEEGLQTVEAFNIAIKVISAIEDIKAEIQKALDEDKATDTENAKVQAIALMWCLEIIDKHTKGESE